MKISLAKSALKLVEPNKPHPQDTPTRHTHKTHSQDTSTSY